MRSNVSVDRAVIQQLKLHAVLQPLGPGSGPGFGELFLRQGDAGDMRAEIARQGQRHAAPAAADVQHPQSGPVEAQLGGDVALLGGLRFFQRFVAPREIGAGILAVPVQEQAVQPAIQVIVVRDIAARPARRVVLQQAPAERAEMFVPAQRRMARAGCARRLSSITSRTS